ncbi:MAG: tetratricopeptide repeat protein [Fimbriimonadaceae bacterium]
MLKNVKSLWVGIVVLLCGQAVLQKAFIFPTWQKNYSVEAGGQISSQLSPDQILLQLFGFREFLAGILWVRADGFFDEGNYDAILPIIKLCTTLDPKQIDIYATGMWHIGYNFTDEQQRSDRRYIASALALGKQGARQNPETYELFFETGWMWFHKIQDDPWQAVKWFQEAHRRSDILQARKNLLAHAYMRNGQIDDAIAEYFKLYDEAVKSAKVASSDYSSTQVRDTLENNLDTEIVRMVQRGYAAEERHDGSFEKGDYDVNPPFDTGFSCRMVVTAPRVVHFEGTWNVLPVGTRIRVVLRDADYPGAKIAELDWDGSTNVNLDPSVNRTYMQDDLYVKNRRFNHDVDMSKDPTMYPCVSKDYLVEFYYSPRIAPPHIQDKFGWNGEGMKDKNFSREDIRPALDFTYDPIPMASDRGKQLAPITIKSPGQRVFYTTLTLTRDQLLRLGKWTNETPTVATSNYKQTSSSQDTDQVIKVPTLRGK